MPLRKFQEPERGETMFSVNDIYNLSLQELVHWLREEQEKQEEVEGELRQLEAKRNDKQLSLKMIKQNIQEGYQQLQIKLPDTLIDSKETKPANDDEVF